MPILFSPLSGCRAYTPDTLYHYNIANNVLKPCFTLDNVMQEDKYIVTSLHETPEYYWSRVTIGPAKMPSDGSPVRMTVFNVRVSKKMVV